MLGVDFIFSCCHCMISVSTVLLLSWSCLHVSLTLLSANFDLLEKVEIHL